MRLSMEPFESSKRDKEILRLLARGEREIEAGEGHALEAVLAEADALLDEKAGWKVKNRSLHHKLTADS